MKWTPRDTAQQLQRLARYTHIVHFSKYSLVALAAVLLIMVFLVPVLHEDDSGARLVFTNVEESGVSVRPRMSNPSFRGVDKDGLPYTLNSRIAERQDDGTVLLTAPEGDVTLSNGSWVAFAATQGVYDSEKNTLFLPKEVEIYHDAGYDMRTTQVRADLKRSTAKGNQPIKGQGPLGRLEADGFRMDNEAGLIVFTPNVKVTLYTKGMKED